MGTSGVVRGTRRKARSRSALARLRADIDGWLTARRQDAQFHRFSAHFDALDLILHHMLERIETAIDAVSVGASVPTDLALTETEDPGDRQSPSDSSSSGTVYEACRTLERSILTARRIFEWYATKYDQRLDERFQQTLLAADELVRSCWTAPFTALGVKPPTGPLTYLDERFDAFATRRDVVPPDLRAKADAVVADLVASLPVPTIALPSSATEDARWLVLVAHETGHHVQRDLLPGLVARTATAVSAAIHAAHRREPSAVAGDAEPDEELVEAMAVSWGRWAAEAFADAYSVLMVGNAATWAVDELQHASPNVLVRTAQDGDTYPPPLVRLALLTEIGRAAGLDSPMPTAAQARAWLDALPPASLPPAARRSAEHHLRVVPSVAAALVDLPIGTSTLLATSGLRTEWFAAAGRGASWSFQLVKETPVITPLDDRPAARVAVGAGFLASERAEQADDGETVALVGSNLRALLRRCGPKGTLAAEQPIPDLPAIAERLTVRLLNTLDDGSDT